MTKPMLLRDTYTMFSRCMLRAARSPESVIMAVIVPVVMMVLFGYVFGGIADVGEISYLTFVVPGIIIQCITQASQSTSYSVHNDMQKGIVDRFRSMAIAKSAFMSGHVGVSFIRCLLVALATFGAAFAMGFRTNASLTDWLIVAGILLLFIIAFTWVSVVFGLFAPDAESLNGMGFLVTIMVFLSSAFTPPETLPLVLRVFAENQPMTPVISATRGLLLGMPTDGDIARAVIWCAGISVLAFTLAVVIYKRKLTR
jgi:ABC-2 type transport system permease protein